MERCLFSRLDIVEQVFVVIIWWRTGVVVVVSLSIVSMDGGCGSPTMWGLVIVGCG